MIKTLVEGLTFTGDEQLTIAIIDGLSMVLQVGTDADNGENRFFALMEEHEGSTKLENLQEHENDEVHDGAVRILQTYCWTRPTPHPTPNDEDA